MRASQLREAVKIQRRLAKLGLEPVHSKDGYERLLRYLAHVDWENDSRESPLDERRGRT